MSDFISLEELFEASTGTGATGNPKPDRTGALIRHCMVAVSKKLGGSAREKSRGARNICQAQMKKYGFLTQGRVPGSYKPTAKGSRRNMSHAMEPTNAQKQSEYEKLKKAER